MEEEGEEVQEYNREVVTVEVDGEAVTEDVEWPGVEGKEGGRSGSWLRNTYFS